jgi:hypothetical protein
MTASTETSTAARPAQTKRPDFFIVGHPKSGTTALYEMLRSHPQIFMPELKEPWFFADDMRPRFPPPRQPQTPQSLAEYLALFAPARPGQRAGEATSTYLLSRDAAGGIGALVPDAQIIAILREPASFLRSLHQQLLRTHAESKKSLAGALALEPVRRQGRQIPRRSPRPQLLMYSDHVRYVEQLRRYHDVFGRERVLVLIYEEFRADNEATVRAVRRFLGVDDTPPVEVTDANQSVHSIRSQHLDDLLNRVSVGRGPASRAVKAALKAVVPSQARRRAIAATQRHLVMGPPAPPEHEVMAELRVRFKGEVAALSEYLDRDLATLWGYDGLD